MKTRKVDRPVEKSISLPRSLVERVDLMLFSAVENKIPFGEWGKYVARLIRRDLIQVPEALGRARTLRASDTDPIRVLFQYLQETEQFDILEICEAKQ